MSDQFTSSMNQLIQEQAKSVESLQVAYPHIRSLCTTIASELYKILQDFQIENLEEAPDPIKNIKRLADGIANEPTNILLRISESRGFMRAAQTSVEIRKSEEQAKEISEDRIDRVTDKLKSGELDPDEKRKVGTRPESLKSIRQAQEKLDQEKDT